MRVNRADLADILGIAASTVSKRVDDGMPFIHRPSRKGGGPGDEWMFDTVDVIQWLVNGASDEPKESARDRAELREREAIASLKELELGQRQKVLVHVDEVAEVVNEQFAVIKSRMKALPARLAQQIAIESDPAECRRMLREEVNSALEGIAGAEIDEEPDEPGEDA